MWSYNGNNDDSKYHLLKLLLCSSYCDKYIIKPNTQNSYTHHIYYSHWLENKTDGQRGQIVHNCQIQDSTLKNMCLFTAPQLFFGALKEPGAFLWL